MRRPAAIPLLSCLFLVACASGPDAREDGMASNPSCLSSEIDAASNPRVAGARVQPPECERSESAVLWTTEKGDDEPIDFRREDDED